MVVNGITRRLAPAIRPYVEELFSSGLFSQDDLELVTPVSGLTSHKIIHDPGDDVCDRFKLVISCAGYPIVWEVIFDGTCSETAPDFIFDDESFLCDCDLDSIPSLVNWDPENNKSFVNVISDLLKLYSKHQWQEAERNINDTIGKWLDFETVQNFGWKVEVLYGSPSRNPPASVPRLNSLQLGYTSVLVKVPVSRDLIGSENTHFSVRYTFKGYMQSFEEKINCSPELEGWLRPYGENFKKRNRWHVDCNVLSATIQSLSEEITDLFRKSVQDIKQKQNLLMSVYHSVMKKEDASPSLLEFDWKDYTFSSYLLSDKRLFTVDIFTKNPRGRVYDISDDCCGKTCLDVKAGQLTDPNFDIYNLLAKHNL